MKDLNMEMQRRSPVHLPGKPAKAEMSGNWQVVVEYADEGNGPWIVDLSHCPRWDIQGRDLGAALPSGLSLPDSPGNATLQKNGLMGRTGVSQAFLWLFDHKEFAPPGNGWTDITEAGFCVALMGRHVFQIMEKLTPLDLGGPKRTPPFLMLGPFSHLTSQIVVLKNKPTDGVVLIAGARGFAHDSLHALLMAGEEFGLRPAGFDRARQIITSIIPYI